MAAAKLAVKVAELEKQVMALNDELADDVRRDAEKEMPFVIKHTAFADDRQQTERGTHPEHGNDRQKSKQMSVIARDGNSQSDRENKRDDEHRNEATWQMRMPTFAES